MILFYLKIALKTIGKYRFYSAISFGSLTIGFLCLIAANVVSAYMRSWDVHFPDAERIFTVNSSNPNPRSDGLPFVPRHLVAYLSNDIPEIEFAATEREGGELAVSVDGVATSLRMTFVEGDFLSIFPLPIVSVSGPMRELPPNGALIMEAAAIERFGSTQVEGKTLIVGQRIELNIVGVISAMSEPSHLTARIPGGRDTDVIAPMRVLDEIAGVAGGSAENWHDRSYSSYVKLVAGAPLEPEHYTEQLRRFSERHVPPTYYATGPHHTVFAFRPLAEAAPSYLRLLFGQLSVTTLMVFAGLLVLVVACLNTSNLAIAQLVRRTREIAVHKVLGATRRQLVAQYGLESLLLAGLALVVALAVAAFVMTSVDELRAVGFHPRLLLTPGLWASAISGVIVVVLIAGAYPALRVAGRSLTSMMRPLGATGYSRRLRSFMIGTQFVLSGALLILAAFIVLQHRTMLSQVPSASLDPVFVLKGMSPATADELDAFEAALRRHESVEATTRTKLVPWELSSEAIALWRTPDTRAPFVALNRITVGYDYFDVMKIPLIAGRTFSPEYGSDLYPIPEEIRSAVGPYSVVIDEATAARLGWEVPAQALGEVIYTGYLPPVVDEPRLVALTVIGVVANRHLEIAAIGYAPTHAFTLSPREANNILVRPSPSAVAAALAHVDRQWSTFYPLSKAAPEFIEDVFRRSYSAVDRIGSTLVALAVFVFIVSAVGLLGMAAFIVGLRQREVAIRRVLGASKGGVLRLLLRDFSKPVLIANLIAWPLGFVLASVYLSVFYVRTDAMITPFLLSFAISAGVAVLTAAYQARRTASAPPATVLKYE